jgi:hypothetical protein
MTGKSTPFSKAEVSAAAIFIATFAGSLGWLAAGRSYFTFGVETDFLISFMVDAGNFLNGEPLMLAMHPPLYSIFLAVSNSLVDDWFVAGRLIAVISATAVIATSFLFYRSIMTPAAGWGAVVALALSPVFVAFSTLATSDVFFLALYSIALLLAFHSDNRSSTTLWAITGMTIGCALLTRTNAVTLLVLALVPWFSFELDRCRRAVNFASLVTGAALPLVGWVMYANISGSNLMPSEGATVNLAWNYFRPEGVRYFQEATLLLQGAYSSLWDVIMADPVKVAKAYTHDLLMLPIRILSRDGLFFPFGILVIPALIWVIFARPSKWLLVVAALILAQVAVMNLVIFEARFYLFLVPTFGALVGLLAGRLYSHFDLPGGSRSLALVVNCTVVAVLVAGVILSYARADRFMRQSDTELHDSITLTRQVIEPEAILVARKPPLAYHTGADPVYMPSGDDIEDLEIFLADLAAQTNSPLFVYYGSWERRTRPEYQALADSAIAREALPRFHLLAQSTSDVKWALYAYRADAPHRADAHLQPNR